MPSSSNNNSTPSSGNSSSTSNASAHHHTTANSSAVLQGTSSSSSAAAAATISSSSAAAAVSAVHGRDLFLSRAINQSYHIIAKIGEGISGSVYKAIKRDTNEMVALKNFKNGSESERASKEECHLLMQLKHIPHITPVLDVVISTNEYNIVFPYFEHDLSGLLSEHRFSIPQVKCYFKQLLQGIQEIHMNGVMHRDIKAANILINNKGHLFIGDLGTATSYTKRSVFSNKVVTLWYRAPELLLGATTYGPEIDMWSIGSADVINSKWFKASIAATKGSTFKGFRMEVMSLTSTLSLSLIYRCVLIELVTSRNFFARKQ
ncbi:putative protein serine/threonine kinase [Cavenderia fasciculata]|uniref:Protein kinase domain-containing protein n=1 Tax=Cavenderia fasciculata TaxID=261658 RepID=F4PLF7_CACFS|nr:putative protein serine/threonine kinase [Cavenderia fasciculata]EGG23379.1 putative protein serine/threonine kinase [Cavenderia fasciculata]|eukprot:XP_004361230.1 putative protein serine/threonine kinase [Cavenderia fasciculata]